MILAIHLTAINGNPFCVSAVGAEDSECVCAIGPALVRPQDWMVPEGSPRTHRQCVKWGIPIVELLCAILRMAENASVFVAHDFPATERSLLAWAAAAKISDKRLAAWNRPGPERVDIAALLPSLPVAPKDATGVLEAYRIALGTGIAA